MSILNMFRLPDDRLPTEYPWREALKIYIRQLKIFGWSIVVGLLLIVGGTGASWLVVQGYYWVVVGTLVCVLVASTRFLLVRRAAREAVRRAADKAALEAWEAIKQAAREAALEAWEPALKAASLEAADKAALEAAREAALEAWEAADKAVIDATLKTAKDVRVADTVARKLALNALTEVVPIQDRISASTLIPPRLVLRKPPIRYRLIRALRRPNIVRKRNPQYKVTYLGVKPKHTVASLEVKPKPTRRLTLDIIKEVIRVGAYTSIVTILITVVFEAFGVYIGFDGMLWIGLTLFGIIYFANMAIGLTTGHKKHIENSQNHERN